MTGKPARIRRPANETKAVIIEAAREDLLELGNELEVNRIAKRARLSEGIVYYHFKNRAGLLDALVRDHYQRLDNEVAMIRFQGETWAERERQRIEAMANLYYGDPVARLITHIVRADPKLLIFERERTERILERGTRNIQEAQAAGEIPSDLNPRVLVSMLLAGNEAGILTAACSTPPIPKQQAVEDVYAFLCRAAGLHLTGKPSRGCVD